MYSPKPLAVFNSDTHVLNKSVNCFIHFSVCERFAEKGKDVGDEWEQYIEEEKKKQLDAIIQDENLKPQETANFMKRAFADGYVTETGTGIAKILPPVNPFLPESGEKKQTVIDKLKAYLSRFLGISDDDFSSIPPAKIVYADEDRYAEEIPMSLPMAAEPLLPPDPD